VGRAEHSKSPEFLEWLHGLGTVVETHGSWVVLRADQALKFKKPVDLGFLDFSSREKRQTLCHREVELNRRLAPDVYLSVLPLYRGPAGYTLGQDGTPGPGAGEFELVDHAVAMRRMAEDVRADVMLARGQLDRAHIRRLARRLVGFHASLPHDSAVAAFGSAEAVAGNVRENFDELEPLAHEVLSPFEWQTLQAAQLAFLRERTATFEGRVQGGHVRDGHGDLRLEHVYFEGDEVVVVDCIEFNDRFRYADTALDTAFLSMDLRHSGRSDLAEDFLAEVAMQSGDYEAYALTDFYESYRATVRGKVAAFRESQLGRSTRAAEAVHHEARAFLLQALASMAKRPAPGLICFGGLIASGKSTLARAIASELHCPHIDSDGTRKRLHGVDPWTPLVSAPFNGAYTPDETGRTYGRVHDLARIVLDSGRTAVVDASFSSRSWRQRFAELARACGCPISFVECHADETVTKQRLLRRADVASVSDGRLATLDSIRHAYEPIADGELPRILRCDTSQSDDGARDQVLRFLASTS
jgi:uncharacterized protein